jgi:hypothetical protein
MCHMSCPSHSSWFDHPNNIWWWVQIIKLLTPLLPRPSWTQISSSATYSRTLSVYVHLSKWETKFQTHTQQQAKL